MEINWNQYLKIGIVLIPIITSCFLFLPSKTITIKPDNHPEIIFWSSPTTLSDDSDVLDDMSDNKIGFVVVLKEEYIGGDKNDEIIEHIQNLVDHDVNFHISIGLNDYISLENGDNVYADFVDIKQWLEDNNLYDDVISVCIDAESPKDYYDEIVNVDSINSLKYFTDSIHDKEQNEYIEDKLDKFIDLVHQDNKEVGIVMFPGYMDCLDGDNDYSLFSRTIYGLDLDWDWSSVMLYRTWRHPSPIDYILRGLEDLHYMDQYQISYYQYSDEDKYSVSLPEFYFQVCTELSGNIVDVPRDKRYIFIGNFHHDYKDTTWVNEKEYLDDIDICRHFGVDRIYMYLWSYFKARYGEEDGIEDLIEHLNHHKQWTLTIPSYVLYRELLLGMMIPLFDRFIYVELHISIF